MRGSGFSAHFKIGFTPASFDFAASIARRIVSCVARGFDRFTYFVVLAR